MFVFFLNSHFVLLEGGNVVPKHVREQRYFVHIRALMSLFYVTT